MRSGTKSRNSCRFATLNWLAELQPRRHPKNQDHLDHGVLLNSDGTLWIGTWVVAQEHAIKGERISAYMALHEKKSKMPYRQGLIIGWRSGQRDRQSANAPVQTEEGIEFLVEPTSKSYCWIGDGTGEKGYLWVEDDG
jgi:hypothetical protein